jgi:hypothetical protein
MEANSAVLNKHPKVQFSTENITKAREKYAGKILSDNEIIDLAINGDLDSADTVVQWLGSNIDSEQKPVSRFAKILENNFDNIPQDQKEKFLLNGLRLTVGDFRKLHYSNEGWGPSKKPIEKFADSTINMFRSQENLGELLNCMLKFTNNDLRLARHLLEKVPLADDINYGKIGPSSLSYSFYRPQLDTASIQIRDRESKEKAAKTLGPQGEYLINSHYMISGMQKTKERVTKISETHKEYLMKNPKIRLLAFWLDAYSGGCGSSSSSFDNLLEDVYPKSDVDLKTQIMTFVKESLFARKIISKKYYIFERIINKELLEAANIEGPSSPLTDECSEIKRLLDIDKLIKQTKDGKITAEDLVNLIGKSPDLLKYVTEKELQMALDITLNRSSKGTKDYNLATKINKLIKDKQTQQAK